MPVLAHPEYTRAAIADVLAQTVPVRLLLINQGVDDAFREELERMAEYDDARIFLWSHQPSLPSLSATWNRALDFVWACGGTEALVVNNDVRLSTSTIHHLRGVLQAQDALFVSCVGWDEAHWMDTMFKDREAAMALDAGAGWISRGGPDFSCFLISKAMHARFRFDENFVPAFGEDCDMHRRLMLAGEGSRIFSIALPYLHYASATLKTVDPKTRDQINRAIEQGTRAYYQKKWGGSVNGERFVLPFHQTEDRDVTNPALQRMIQEDRAHELPRVDPVWFGQQGNYNPVVAP